MKLGIVTQWFPSGAGYVSKSYERVLGKGHRVFVYARGGRIMRGDCNWDGPNVTWAPFHPSSTGIRPAHFSAWVKRHDVDVVLFNEQRHWAGVVLAKKLGLLVGAYVNYYTQDTVPFFELYDFLVCNTRRHHSVFQHHPQCCYLPWGTQTEVYRPEARPADRPVTFLISAGWSGASTRDKPWMDRRGAGMAMRVFQRVHGQCRLTVLSQVELERCPIAWQQAVREDNRIEFRVGTFDPVPYPLGDVYVYPSRMDGIGLTLPEALSSGLPAITTDCAPMNEFVRNGCNGILVSVEAYKGRPDGYFWAESICNERRLAVAMQYYIDNREMVAIHGASRVKLRRKSFRGKGTRHASPIGYRNRKGFHGVRPGVSRNSRRQQRSTTAGQIRRLYRGF